MRNYRHFPCKQGVSDPLDEIKNSINRISFNDFVFFLYQITILVTILIDV